MAYSREFDPNVWTDKAFENVAPGGSTISESTFGGSVGYYSGFLPTGVGQTSSGPSLLSSITQGLETFLPVIFGGRGSPNIVGGPVAGSGGRAISAIGAPSGEHPVITKAKQVGAVGGAVAGTVAATMGGTALEKMMTGGGHGRYGSPGEKGYHMIKKGPHAGQWTRNRHRNVANIRALRRALSRAHGFERICRKVLHFTSPRRSHGRAIFKRRRRRA